MVDYFGEHLNYSNTERNKLKLDEVDRINDKPLKTNKNQ